MIHGIKDKNYSSSLGISLAGHLGHQVLTVIPENKNPAEETHESQCIEGFFLS